MVICYQCGKMLVYVDGKESGSFTFNNRNPKPLNDLLIANHIPLPKPPD